MYGTQLLTMFCVMRTELEDRDAIAKDVHDLLSLPKVSVAYKKSESKGGLFTCPMGRTKDAVVMFWTTPTRSRVQIDAQ